jgi:hypothetical protein
MHADLVQFLMGGHGCTKNREKMHSLLQVITQNRQWAISLESFLVRNFPVMIIDDEKPISVPGRISNGGENKHGVFTYYDPSLATFPRRMIFIGDDLQKKVRDFCAKQFYSETMFIDNHAYIEYIPVDASAYKSEIPEKNWQIRTFKKKNGN